MAEYIEREAMLDSIKDLKQYLNTGIARHNLTQKDIMRVIETFPKADVVEVVHGRWENAHDWMPIYRCSVCKERNLFRNGDNVFSNYCPNCGTRMDGEG